MGEGLAHAAVVFVEHGGTDDDAVLDGIRQIEQIGRAGQNCVDVGMGIEVLVEPERLLIKVGSGIGCGTVGGVTHVVQVGEALQRQGKTVLIESSRGGEDNFLCLGECC